MSSWPDLVFHSDEEDLEDEDDFNSEASVVSTEIVENNNAKVRQVLDEFRSANASMAAEAAEKYPLLKPLSRYGHWRNFNSFLIRKMKYEKVLYDRLNKWKGT